MPFSNARFIKPNVPFDPSFRHRNPAPLFRKRFSLSEVKGENRIAFCGLGYVYVYLNGKPVTEDRLLSPVSDYRKTLWYTSYDITSLLKEGENVIAVECGNGWLNEEFQSAWDHNRAEWRDLPKFILSLTCNGVETVVSDATWKCSPESATVFNALRSGEYFDARLYDPAWNTLSFNDASWDTAQLDSNAPRGVFRQCPCQPIREHEVYHAVAVRQLAPDRFTFDMGQNLSGYVRLTAKGTAGQVLTVRYAEQLLENGERNNNDMEKFFKESEIQTDRFICSGKEMTWSPKFVYHGFRYIEVEGITSPEEVTVQAVFLHQAVEIRGSFLCSDGRLNRAFRAGLISTHSNMFYKLTDCPTREKLGWTNDAQASAEQILTDFNAAPFFKKWLVDIRDAMLVDGRLPGIIPTPEWGYEWGCGPVSDGVLFELPHRLWIHTGNPEELITTLPYFKRYLAMLRTREDSEGFLRADDPHFKLDDWAKPRTVKVITPRPFIDEVLRYKFYGITAIAADLAGEDGSIYRAEADGCREKLLRKYLNADGSCAIHSQTAVALLINHGVCEPTPALANQLKRLVEEADFHHTCGMVGLRHLYDALTACGLEDYVYRILTAPGYPGILSWQDLDGTTLWERWAEKLEEGSHSRNHHMYSYFMAWLMHTVAGIRIDRRDASRPEITVAPHFLSDLSFAEGSYRHEDGSVAVRWERLNGSKLRLRIEVQGRLRVEYNGVCLPAGVSQFTVINK